jgi:hypothetical protein
VALVLVFLLDRVAATKMESLKSACAHTWCIGCAISITFKRVASRKSHTMRRPSKDPVTNWNALFGLSMAHVSKVEDVPLPSGEESVETGLPVATE